MPLLTPIQHALEEKQYTTPSPIQQQAIPILLEGRDLLGSAQTGTGKTAAFAIPILQGLSENSRERSSGHVSALILTPTRELAIQVAKSFETYGKYLNLNHILAYGGVPIGKQIRALKTGADVLIATPGRLLDLHNQGKVHFSQIEYFVLDEADRMLDMGFIHDIRKVVKALPEERQSIFFSATLPEKITQLAQEILRHPTIVKVDPQVKTAEKVDHRVCFIQRDHKIKLMSELLEKQQSSSQSERTIVFSKTKHGADRLSKRLNSIGLRSDAIHGNKSQNARQRALNNFKNGKFQILVATDVAARGIDVKEVSLVVNYDLPNEAEAYVHRIGRTARAGQSGRAYSFCTHEDLKELNSIERLLKQPIAVDTEHAYHDNRLQQKHAEPRKRSKGRPTSKKQSQNSKPRKFRRADRFHSKASKNR